jgi:hypothetical protein
MFYIRKMTEMDICIKVEKTYEDRVLEDEVWENRSLWKVKIVNT